MDLELVVLKGAVTDHGESVSMTEMRMSVIEEQYRRQSEDFNLNMDDLKNRIEKAEKDRMHKYYGQVSELNDWATSVKKKIEDTTQMCNSLAHYFSSEHQVFTLNLITETMSKCLGGRELNKMIDEVEQK